MKKLKLLVWLASLLAVAATLHGLTIRVPFLPDPAEPPAVAQVRQPVEVPQPPRDVDGAIRWSVRPTHGAALPSSEAHVLITLDADRLAPVARAPINLALVLDRSGSMSARHKLEYAKAAAHLVIDQLAKGDRVALVAFDSVSTILLPSSPVGDKAALHAAVDSISPGGSTNISGGLMDGLAEMQRGMNREHVNRVLLLTDGLSNFGETSLDAFAKLARTAASSGIAISTVGLGAEFSEDVLTTIAEHSGGHYYYVDNPEQMTAIFSGEVHGMQAVVARDVRVRLEGVDAVVEQVIGYRGPAMAPGAPLALGDMYSGQQRTLVVRVRMPQASSGGVRVRLTYQDARRKREVSGEKFAVIRGTDSVANVDASVDRDVLEKVESVRAAARMEEAMTQLDHGDRAACERLITQQLGSTKRTNDLVVRSRQLDKQMSVMKQALDQLQGLKTDSDDLHSYVKANKAAAYELTR